MKSREFNPKRLDVEAFARDGGEQSGESQRSAFERLNASTLSLSGNEAPVQWSVRGELRNPRAAAPEIWLHLKADARVRLECQRCLQPVEEVLVVDRSIRFASDEEQAARLDAEIEDDVLAMGRPIDVLELVEDELLLALPIVPRHDVCPEPLASAHTRDGEPEPERLNPFEVLRGMKPPTRQ